VVLPDLPAFAQLPRDAAVFYDGSVDGLERVLADLEQWSEERLQQRGGAARAYAGRSSWADVARQTLAAIEATK
jgi:hypothetical protein